MSVVDPSSATDDATDEQTAERQRYRCGSCGNLTRFDVVMTRRTRAFHHFTVGGELTVEDEQVLEAEIEEVVCRWCGTADAVVEASS